MRQKKREREGTQEEKFDADPVANDHELFLQAFEKPTQIYRYLRARHVVLPTFLHRCLSFMKKRSSRTNKRRLTFSIDSMLKDVESKQKKLGGDAYRPDYLNISFIEFCPHEVRDIKGPVHVDVSLLKICPNRRKGSSSTSSTQLGVAVVPLDSAPITASQSKVISVGSEQFATNQVPGGAVNTGSGRSHILSFRTSCQQCKALNGFHQDEPAPKRARLSSSRQSAQSGAGSGTYAAELPIYDKHRRCLLTDGEYELAMTEESSGSRTTAAKWETVNGNQNCGPFDQFNRVPTLKFRITWSRTAGGASSRTCNVGQAENGVDNNNTTVLQEVLCQSKPPPSRTSPSKMRESLSINTNGITNGICQRVYYQFSYNCYLRQQTESRYDYHCPWCMINCMELYALLKHLRLSHARFNFSFTASPLGACIDVSVNDCYDGGYVGNPQDTQSHLGYAYCRHGPVQRTPLTHVIVARPKRPLPTLSEFMEEEECETVRNKQIIQGHNRLYYHTVTNRPVKPNEIGDQDSEGENDPDWLRQKTVLMIDEFTDVNSGEKEIMKMWNLHVMKYNYIGDCQLPAACQRFVEEYGHTIINETLHRNLLAHLVNLNDTGLVGSDTILNCSLLLYAMEGKS